jgi:hypothetical protein
MYSGMMHYSSLHLHFAKKILVTILSVLAPLLSCASTATSDLNNSEILRCSGDLFVQSQTGKAVPGLRKGTVFTSLDSSKLTVLDKNGREIVRFWPWMSIQSKVLLSVHEQQSRKLMVRSDGMSWISIEIDSTSERERNRIFCEIGDAG